MENILKNISENEHINNYRLFKDYCLFKEKGLRKEAFKSLNSFIAEVKEWDTKKQQSFVCWLFGLFEVSEDIHHVLVHPLEENLLKPLLEEWMNSNPQDSRPHRWYGLFLNTDKTIKHLKSAIEIGGFKEQNALLKLIDVYFYSLWYSFHHISEDLYLGDMNEDKLLIEKIEKLNSKVEIEHNKKGITKDLLYYKNLMNDWIEFKKETSEGFVEWCKHNGKEYEWTKSYYYD